VEPAGLEEEKGERQLQAKLTARRGRRWLDQTFKEGDSGKGGTSGGFESKRVEAGLGKSDL